MTHEHIRIAVNAHHGLVRICFEYVQSGDAEWDHIEMFFFLN